MFFYLPVWEESREPKREISDHCDYLDSQQTLVAQGIDRRLEVTTGIRFPFRSERETPPART